MKRLTPGNIFQIIHETEIRYFQYFYTDQNYLGGDLIWVFNCKEQTIDLEVIVKSGYSFYFYTTINAGVKLKQWKLIGNKPIPKEMQYYPKFRWSKYHGNNLEDWYILCYDKKEHIGKNITDKQMKIPFASISFPKGAVKEIIGGKENFKNLF